MTRLNKRAARWVHALLLSAPLRRLARWGDELHTWQFREDFWREDPETARAWQIPRGWGGNIQVPAASEGAVQS